MTGTKIAGFASYGSNDARRIPLEPKRPLIIEEEVKEVLPWGAESFTTTMMKADKLNIIKSGGNLLNQGDIVEILE